jgi:hypothetical protein
MQQVFLRDERVASWLTAFNVDRGVVEIEQSDDRNSRIPGLASPCISMLLIRATAIVI